MKIGRKVPGGGGTARGKGHRLWAQGCLRVVG